MSRPTVTTEVTDRENEVGTFEVSKLGTNAPILKAYAGLLDAVTKSGGRAESYWNGVKLYVLKSEAELQSQLETDQRLWDSAQALYLRAIAAEEGDDLREWERDTVKRWAEAEGKPSPFDVFAANDPELAELRESLGMSA